jgi:hypothetical protein
MQSSPGPADLRPDVAGRTVEYQETQMINEQCSDAAMKKKLDVRSRHQIRYYVLRACPVTRCYKSPIVPADLFGYVNIALESA